ncbi:hypothetical protein AeMF1_008614, partial [Aphanomyces euteiches]
MVYCRQDTKNLMNALDNMKRGIRIYGPPGVGKSITTWYWICNQVQSLTKTVLWIHVSKRSKPRIARLTRDVTYYVPYQADEIIRLVDNAQEDIVVIDGVTNRVDHADLESVVFGFDHNPNRKAISVASMSIKTNLEDENLLKLSAFEAAPWSLDEYYQATENEVFFKSVRHFLVNDECSEDVSEESKVNDDNHALIDEKYYYAGCSARWMFGTTIPDVIQQIDKYFRSAPNFVDLLKGIVGSQSPDMVNHLACEQGPSKNRFFTSQHISRKAISTGGDEIVRLAYGVANGLENDSFTGWIVEMDFIQQIMDAQGGGLDVKLNDGTTITFEVAKCVRCDTDLLSMDSVKKAIKEEPTAASLNNVWLVPTKWYQAGYDLVCLRICKDLLVLRFIQVTAAKVHGQKLQHFRALALKFFNRLGLVIHGIEIFMAIPSDIANCEIPDSKVQGQICDWFVGNITEFTKP